MTRKCAGCSVEVTDDGHGELVHVVESGAVDAFVYGCDPKTRSKTEYPVAR